MLQEFLMVQLLLIIIPDFGYYKLPSKTSYYGQFQPSDNVTLLAGINNKTKIFIDSNTYDDLNIDVFRQFIRICPLIFEFDPYFFNDYILNSIDNSAIYGSVVQSVTHYLDVLHEIKTNFPFESSNVDNTISIIKEAVIQGNVTVDTNSYSAKYFHFIGSCQAILNNLSKKTIKLINESPYSHFKELDTLVANSSHFGKGCFVYMVYSHRGDRLVNGYLNDLNMTNYIRNEALTSNEFINNIAKYINCNRSDVNEALIIKSIPTIINDLINQSQPLGFPITVYRGLSRMLEIDNDLNCGDIYINQAFMSTTYSANVALGFTEKTGCLLKIHIDSDYPVGLIPIDCSEYSEQEVLLNPHGAYFIIKQGYELIVRKSIYVYEMVALNLVDLNGTYTNPKMYDHTHIIL